MQDILRMTKENAESLINKKESDFFDKKSARISGHKVEKAAVAFANSDGGELVLGLEDRAMSSKDGEIWSGLESIEAYNGILQSLHSLNPSIDFRYNFISCDDYRGIVLQIFIEKSMEVAKCSDGKVYQRVGAQSLPISDPNKILALAFAKGAKSFESSGLDELPPEEIVDSTEIRDFCENLSPVQEPLAFCINEGLIDRRTFTPSCAAALLFADNPQAVLPRRCGVRVVFYDTKMDIPEREHLKVNKSFSGPMYKLLHNVSREVTGIMSNISIMTTNGLEKISYPPEAIWEVLVNALIHRDYSISDDVYVYIYQNRIEIRSPGKLPGIVNISNYLDVRYSRNPKIVRNLARYKNPPNKDLGEGLNTVFQKMKEWKLKEPMLLEEGNYVKVIISHTRLASAEELVLEYLENNLEIRNGVARDITGIHSENQMKEVFYRLRDKNLIERVPDRKGKAAAWRKVARTI